MYDVKSVVAEAATSVASASQLPTPAGWHILIALPEVEERTAGGIIRPDELRSREETAGIVGYVMKMGLDCYANPVAFPNGPWCKEGDWIVFRPYSGLRMVIHGKEFRIIKDNEVDAVVVDPSGIVRSSRT